MPWHVENSPSKCSTSKPWVVIKDSDGSVVGCHATKEAANKQLAALNAQENSAEPLADKQEQMAENDLPRDGLIRGVMPLTLERNGDSEDAAPTMVGHFARFNEWTEINSIFEGHFMERFVPGAFRKTFKESRDRIRSLFQHGQDPQLGDKPLGRVEVLREDDEGAYYEVPLLRDDDGNPVDYLRSIIPGLKAGLYGASFRFQVMKEEFEAKPKRGKHNPEGLPERTVTEAKVMEFGPVTFPAYAGATAGVRSLTDEFVLAHLLRDPDRARALLKAAPEPQHSRKEEPEPSEATTPGDGSRSTRPRHDYLTNGKELPPWQL